MPLSVRGKGKTFFGFALSVIIVVFGLYAHTYINFKIVLRYNIAFIDVRENA